MSTGNRPGYREHIVSAIEEIDEGVFVIAFHRIFDFLPGQIVGLSVDRDDPSPRLYSICSAQDDKEMKILFNVIPEGKITRRLAALRPGDSLFCSEPYGSFTGGDDPATWVATGTGIAPFVSQLLSGKGADNILIHGGRGEKSFYFAEEIKKILGNRYIRCSSTITKDPYFKGRVTGYLKEWDSLPADNRYYLCGSAEMVVEARDLLISRGIPFDKIESEIYF